MPSYVLESQTLPDPFCPETHQQLLDAHAAHLLVSIPTNLGVVISPSEPGASDQDKLWVKTMGSAPWVEGAFVYVDGAWRQVPGKRLYFTDTGAANAWTISTGESISSVSYITGRLFLIRVGTAVTGATTLTIDTLPAKGVKKANTSELVTGDVAAGQLALVAYDDVSDVFELVTTLGVSASATSEFSTASDQSLPASAGSAGAVTVATGLSSVRRVDVWLKCTDGAGESGWAQNDEVRIEAAHWDTGADDFNIPYIVRRSAGSVIIEQPSGTAKIANKGTGDTNASASFTPSKWKFNLHAYGAV